MIAVIASSTSPNIDHHLWCALDRPSQLIFDRGPVAMVLPSCCAVSSPAF